MTLFLLPNLLSEEASENDFLPSRVAHVVSTLQGVFAESEKGARRYLRRFTPRFREIPLQELSEHTRPSDIKGLLKPLLSGEKWGVLSDAGLPCLADPGSLLVREARALGIHIEALVGPSAAILALLLSGFPANAFSFHGYLERESAPLAAQIRQLEQRARQERASQIFIETPYRNLKLFGALLETLADKTQLCIAWDLTAATQGVSVLSVAAWKKTSPPPIHKKPAVFLLC